MRPLPSLRIAALGLAGLIGLSGCAQSPDYASSTAASLQRQVAAVTTDAAGQQYQQALDKLDDLQAAAARAQAAGKLPPKREASIGAAIGRVRRDLQSAVTAAQQAALDAKLNSLSEQQQSLLTQQQQLAQQQQQSQQANTQPTQQSDTGSSKDSKPKDSKAPPTAPQGGGPGKNSGSGPDDNSGKGPKG
jgi:chromosome segregation ATPase